MECADGHLRDGVLGDHAGDAFLHLGGGLVGEGDGKNLRWRDFSLQHVGDAAGDGTCLSRTGTGENHDRAVLCGDSLALGVVQGLECEIVCHGREESILREVSWQCREAKTFGKTVRNDYPRRKTIRAFVRS